MRDLETIASAITIAETGHLVLATLHTNNAAQSLDRMIDVFPPYQQQQIRVQLSNILQGVMSQRLIPAIGGGRVVAAEVMISTAAVRNIIREGKTHQLDAVIQTSGDQGMIPMDKALANLVKAGHISEEEARGYAIDLQELERLLHN
jgi:twitching motility protein PilT